MPTLTAGVEVFLDAMGLSHDVVLFTGPVPRHLPRARVQRGEVRVRSLNLRAYRRGHFGGVNQQNTEASS